MLILMCPGVLEVKLTTTLCKGANMPHLVGAPKYFISLILPLFLLIDFFKFDAYPHSIGKVSETNILQNTCNF